jgi:RNA polymerase sigma factor (sigma-70 family)
MVLRATDELPEENVETMWADETMSHDFRSRFESAYREYREAVQRLLRRRLGDDPNIPDLMQEAYLRILRYRDCDSESLKLLLFRTALNLATSHGIRACTRLTHVPLEDIEIAMDTPSPEDEAESDQRMQYTMAAVQSLPDRCRQVFLLRLIHGLRQREIAERCGISTRCVEMHLARAQVLIRERVGELAA